MLQPKSVDDCLFLNYDIKAEFLYEEYDLNKYICLLIKRFGIINNLRKVCSNSISSCLSRYLILKELSIKGIDIEKYNIEGEFKIQFCKDLLNKITSLCLYELEDIANIVEDICNYHQEYFIEKNILKKCLEKILSF